MHVTVSSTHALGNNFCNGCVRLVQIATGHYDACTVEGERSRRLIADPGIGASYDGNFRAQVTTVQHGKCVAGRIEALADVIGTRLLFDRKRQSRVRVRRLLVYVTARERH